jgi:hypothetical protein
MPALLALCLKTIDNVAMAPFAAFGSICLLMLVDFTGPLRSRLQAQAALSVAGGVLICAGTLASRAVWLAALAMAVVALLVIFAGVVSSVLAGATTALLLAFILPTSLPATAAAIPDRLAGWGLAAGAAYIAIAVLWPAPERNPLRAAAVDACHAVAARLRADVARATAAVPDADARQVSAAAAAHDAVTGLHRAFLGTPWQPAGLSTSARAVVRLVDELLWLDAVLGQSDIGSADPSACRVKLACAAVLDHGADSLDGAVSQAAGLETALVDLGDAIKDMERVATVHLPIQQRVVSLPDARVTTGAPVEEFLSSLDPAFRAQELSFATTQIATNMRLAVAADRRRWIDTVLGRQPGELSGQISAASDRVSGHLERHSVWLHNSVRGAIGLALAVLVAEQTGVEHSFWVILGTFSVLRSNALNTGHNVLRGLLGTAAGFVVGAALIELVGTSPTVLWLLLPPALLLAGFAPSAVSFAAGQAGFTLALVILFNLLQPTGWRVGLVRVEDVAIGCAVSLLVGVLFWPRGAGAALGDALSEAYADSAAYLAAAVGFGMRRCVDGSTSATLGEGTRAAFAARRLDDAFRTYLAERGSKPMPLAEVTALVTGVAGLRQVANAVVDLWREDDGSADGDRAAARSQLSASAGRVTGWYGDLATSLAGRREPPVVMSQDPHSDGRLIDAVRQDLSGGDGLATATAVRMIWTGDHLDAARVLQASLVEPARAARQQRAAHDRWRLATARLRPG